MGLGNILITWSHGFIGSHLCDELTRAGIEYSRFQWDLSNIGDIESNIPEWKFDSIIHLAGTYVWDLQSQMQRNVDHTSNLLGIASKKWIKKVIFSSSWAVYGNTTGNNSREDDALEPNTEYWYTKRIAEDMLLGYSRFAWITAIILRFPNVYWPGSRGVIATFTSHIKEQGMIYLSWDGLQLRNYLYVNDAVSAIVKALDYDKTDIFNITNPIPLSLLQVIDSFKKKYQFEVVRKDDGNSLKNLVLDHEKAKRFLNFQAQYTDLVIN